MLKNVLQICAIAGVLVVEFVTCDDTVNSPANWAVNVLQDGVSVNSLDEIVIGYDFNPNEMKSLKLWDRGIVLYYIDVVSYDKVLRDRIRTFLDVTNGLSGLQFLELPSPPTDSETRWVFFVNRRGLLDCNDHSLKNFTTTGVQQVILGYDCLTKGGLAEVVLALAGVPPQHNAPNRDKYVEIDFDNVIPEKRYLFEKVKFSEWLFYDIEYDFFSAGHYDFHKHTINGGATIQPQEPVDVFVGEKNGFSFTDILKIRLLYNYIRKPKVDELSSNCKTLFKPGANLKLYYPREKQLKDDNLPMRKPVLYRLFNKDYVDYENTISSDDAEIDFEVQEDNEGVNTKSSEKDKTNKSSVSKYDEEKNDSVSSGYNELSEDEKQSVENNDINKHNGKEGPTDVSTYEEKETKDFTKKVSHNQSSESKMYNEPSTVESDPLNDLSDFNTDDN